eukprot:s333_g6.t1
MLSQPPSAFQDGSHDICDGLQHIKVRVKQLHIVASPAFQGFWIQMLPGTHKNCRADSSCDMCIFPKQWSRRVGDRTTSPASFIVPPPSIALEHCRAGPLVPGKGECGEAEEGAVIGGEEQGADVDDCRRIQVCRLLPRLETLQLTSPPALVPGSLRRVTELFRTLRQAKVEPCLHLRCGRL